ncbi:MAG: TetR/AcrR family transcriptional regulator [Rubrivivax sp.]|nr:MAG: TetR/AcrR family transcriptional regulator [Rubrivivax sp.]
MTSKPSRKEATHDRILETAARAIRRAGYDGVGVAEVMKEAGLTHGGFYAHFESREALLAEAMTRARKDSAAAMSQRVAARQARGASALRALVECYLSEAHLAAMETGCPVAALGSEMARQPPLVREAACDGVRGMLGLVRQALPAGTDPDLAMVIASTLVGTLQLARSLGNNKQGKALLAASRKALIAQYDQAPAGAADESH